LATLAKTPQNRGLICNTEGLLRVLAELMMENAVKIEDKEEPKQPTVQRQRGSNDDSTNGRDDLSSYPSEDEQMLSNTYSGTFSHGSGTFTEELYSDEENSEDGEDASLEESDGYSTYSEESMEEEGVEMQISSLKKLNIENHGDFLARSQLSACATLIHLTKHCANAVSFSQLRCQMKRRKRTSFCIYISTIHKNIMQTAHTCPRPNNAPKCCPPSRHL
jgi:hypothetical protein